VTAWITWRGRHPDPELSTALTLQRRAPDEVPRGPLPEGLAPPGYVEGKVQLFDPTNVYIKIDGREGYYKSFGFEKLHCVSLSAGQSTVDIELYDLGKQSNALGAAAGELPQSAKPEVKDGTLQLIDKNALYFVRGKYYLRAIGSADDAATHSALAFVRDRFSATLPKGELPWAHTLFAQLGVPPAKVAFVNENALSFGFANSVFVASMADGDTELFVAEQRDAKTAASLVDKFNAGFREYGEAGVVKEGVKWVKDRYLARVSAAGAEGRFVFGVRAAADEAAGGALYTKLDGALKALPAAPQATGGK
jgi:hypothetical protein